MLEGGYKKELKLKEVKKIENKERNREIRKGSK